MESKEVLMAKFDMKTKEVDSLVQAMTKVREALDSIEAQLQAAIAEKGEIMEALIQVSES